MFESKIGEKMITRLLNGKWTTSKVKWDYCKFQSKAKECKGKMEYRDHLGGDSLCEYHAELEEKILEEEE